MHIWLRCGESHHRYRPKAHQWSHIVASRRGPFWHLAACKNNLNSVTRVNVPNRFQIVVSEVPVDWN